MSDVTVSQWKNDEIEFSVERLPFCVVVFDVKASAAIVWEAHKEALKEVNKEAKIDGFRKGKAPEVMILRRFPDAVQSAERRLIAHLCAQKIHTLTSIQPFSRHTRRLFDFKTCSSEGAHLTLTFETKPDVPVVQYELFELQPVESIAVTDQHVDEAVRQSLFYFVDWQPVEGRGVEEGDFVVIDLSTRSEETEEWQPVFQGVRFQVKQERMAEWMSSLIRGAHVGDELEGVSVADSTATPEEKQKFQPKKVRVKLLQVENAELPELTDEFAQNLGATDVADLRIRLRSMLEYQVKESREQALREQVNRFLLSTYRFDVPRSLIDSEIEGRKQKRSAEADSANAEQLSQQLFEEAVQVLRLFYLAVRILDQEGVHITHNEVEQFVERQRSQAKNWNQDAEEAARRQAFSTLVLRKAQDLMLEKAQNVVVSS